MNPCTACSSPDSFACGNDYSPSASQLLAFSPGQEQAAGVLKLKLQYFGHLMQRVDSFEKTLMLGGIEGRRRRGQQGIRPSGCEGKLGEALESLQGLRDLT